MAVINTGAITNVVGNSIVIGQDTQPSSPTSPFNTIIPQMLNYAEQRIQRDVDFLQSVTSSTSFSISSGTNVVNTITVNAFQTIQSIGVVSGTGTTPLIPVTKEFLQNVHGDSSVTGVPMYFAMSGGSGSGTSATNNVLVGPYANSAYQLSVTGTTILPSLYPTVGADGYPFIGTGSTFISTYLPDLLLMASMVYISGYQRNFANMGSDPQMGATYESQYQAILKGAMIVEARKKFNSSGWTPLSPAVVASPSR